jgi:uncharacterized membrane protein
MGTSGLVGPITTWITMQESTGPSVLLTMILSVSFIFPAVLALTVSEIMRKLGWIKPGHMKLDL